MEEGIVESDDELNGANKSKYKDRSPPNSSRRTLMLHLIYLNEMIAGDASANDGVSWRFRETDFTGTRERSRAKADSLKTH